MRLSRSWSLCAALCILGCQFLSPKVSHADTYSIVPLIGDGPDRLYGMDDVGHVVFSFPDCGPGGAACYAIYLNGVASVLSTTTAPAYSWDYATAPCSIALLPCSVSKNGRTAFISIEGDGIRQDLFVSSGTGPAQLLLRTDGFVNLAIDGSGDIVFDNGALSEWYEALDVTAIPTPEPSTLLLLATALLALGGFATFRRQIV